MFLPVVGCVGPFLMRRVDFKSRSRPRLLKASCQHRASLISLCPLRRKQNWLFQWVASVESGDQAQSSDEEEAGAGQGEGSGGQNGAEKDAEEEDEEVAGSSSLAKRKANLGGNTGRKTRRS